MTSPAPPPTEKLLAPPVTLHAPPVSAVPNPPLTVRPKASEASTAVADTGTAFVAVLPEPVVPSPKFQAEDATVPSVSADAEASNEAASPEVDAVNDADGGWLAADTVTVFVAVAVAPLSSVTVSATGYPPAPA